MAQIRKMFNLEEVLTSEEFIATKQDMISEKCQTLHPDFLCKVTTYCLADKKFVIHTTEDNRATLGAVNRLLAHRPVAEESLMSLDNDMVNTWEINIQADTYLPDYVTALDIAQARADEMFEEDKTRLPIVTVVDYRWGNPKTFIVPTVFGDVDDDGVYIPPVQPVPIYEAGDPYKGKLVLYPEPTLTPKEVFLQGDTVVLSNPSFYNDNYGTYGLLASHANIGTFMYRAIINLDPTKLRIVDETKKAFLTIVIGDDIVTFDDIELGSYVVSKYIAINGDEVYDVDAMADAGGGSILDDMLIASPSFEAGEQGYYNIVGTQKVDDKFQPIAFDVVLGNLELVS